MKTLLNILVENSPLLIAGIIGFVSAVLAEPVRRWFFSPKIKVDFIEGDEAFRTTTKVGRSDAHFIRVRVLIKGFGIAKQCRAYLVNVEKWNESAGKFEATIYCDSLQLAWSAQENPKEDYAAYRALDIPKGVPQFIDVVRTLRGGTNYRVLTKFILNRYQALFEEGEGKFQYTVLVSSDNAKPKSKKVIFDWSGDWENFEVTAGE